MPYIKPEKRRLVSLYPKTVLNAGELNFAITDIVKSYIAHHGQSYKTFNAVIGVLECAKLELYRRKVSPYEDTKIASNGDVY